MVEPVWKGEEGLRSLALGQQRRAFSSLTDTIWSASELFQKPGGVCENMFPVLKHSFHKVQICFLSTFISHSAPKVYFATGVGETHKRDNHLSGNSLRNGAEQWLME